MDFMQTSCACRPGFGRKGLPQDAYSEHSDGSEVVREWIYPSSSEWNFAVAKRRQIYKLRTAGQSALGDVPVAVGSKTRLDSMQAGVQERRAMRRFDMRLPAIVRLEGSSEYQTETQNVSARGVFFYLDRPVEAGTRLEVTLTFPPHITLTDAIRVRFAARVIRIENPLPSSRIGVAAMIENYEFLRSGGSPDFLSALQNGWKDKITN